MPKTVKIRKPLDFGAWPLTFKMSRGQKVTRKKFLDSLDLYTCQISSISIGGFSRSATGHAFPYWGKKLLELARGPTRLAKFSTGKKNPQPPRGWGRVMKGDSGHPDDAPTDFRVWAKFLRFYDTLLVIRRGILSFSTCNILKNSINLKKGFKKQVK